MAMASVVAAVARWVLPVPTLRGQAMRPTPIPDNEIWEGAIRRVIAPPDGDLTNPDIAPVEALIDRSPATGVVCFSMRCELEDGDLVKLAEGGRVWLTFYGGVPPFCLTVVDKDGHQ